MITKPTPYNWESESAAREQTPLGDGHVNPGVAETRAHNATCGPDMRIPTPPPMVSQSEAAAIPLRRSLFRQ